MVKETVVFLILIKICEVTNNVIVVTKPMVTIICNDF